MPTLLCIAWIASLATPIQGASLASQLDAWARPLADSGYLSGVLVASRSGNLEISAAWGLANHDHEIPNTQATRFAIASLSKPMTTVALLRLVDRGELRLDDRVDRWIPEFPFASSISLTDLLTHKARIPHRVTSPIEETVPLEPGDMVERIIDQGLPGPPDGSRGYSSAGFAVLARIIELVTGQTFAAAMRALVFDPLEMRSTVHTDSRHTLLGRADAYLPAAESLAPAPLKDLSFLAGGGSFWSSAEDVLRFGQAYLDRRLLSDEGWERFHALGWAPHNRVRWNGSNGGWFAFLDIDKEHELVTAFLGNAGMGPVDQLRRAVPQMMLGQPVDPARGAPPAVDLVAAQVAALTGVYEAANGQRIRIEAADRALWLDDAALRPLGDHRFFNLAYWVDVEFVVENEHCREVHILIPGNTRVYERAR